MMIFRAHGLVLAASPGDAHHYFINVEEGSRGAAIDWILAYK